MHTDILDSVEVLLFPIVVVSLKPLLNVSISSNKIPLSFTFTKNFRMLRVYGAYLHTRITIPIRGPSVMNPNATSREEAPRRAAKFSTPTIRAITRVKREIFTPTPKPHTPATAIIHLMSVTKVKTGSGENMYRLLVWTTSSLYIVLMELLYNYRKWSLCSLERENQHKSFGITNHNMHIMLNIWMTIMGVYQNTGE